MNLQKQMGMNWKPTAVLPPVYAEGLVSRAAETAVLSSCCFACSALIYLRHVNIKGHLWLLYETSYDFSKLSLTIIERDLTVSCSCPATSRELVHARHRTRCINKLVVDARARDGASDPVCISFYVSCTFYQNDLLHVIDLVRVIETAEVVGEELLQRAPSPSLSQLDCDCEHGVSVLHLGELAASHGGKSKRRFADAGA